MLINYKNYMYLKMITFSNWDFRPQRYLLHKDSF